MNTGDKVRTPIGPAQVQEPRFLYRPPAGLPRVCVLLRHKHSETLPTPPPPTAHLVTRGPLSSLYAWEEETLL